MKYFLYLFLLLGIVSCTNEEDLKSNIEYSNEFTIVDNPNDSVTHERYLIYKEYGVPVYFNDTISQVQTGTNHKGEPILSYERVDLNWTFFGYNHGIKYTYTYLTNPAEQMQALRFVRKYLEQASRPMRPFSIMLADTLTVASSSRTDRPIYHVGYRTLVFAQIKNLTGEDTINAQIKEVIKNMVSDRVKVNTDVCARFADLGTTNNWYYRTWETLGNCPTVVSTQKMSWTLSVNALFNEPPFSTFDNEDLVMLLLKDRQGVGPYVNSEAEALTIRQNIIDEMGQYGFIRGWKQSGSFTPNNDTEDRDFYIQAILHLGERGFKKRYGHLNKVMEKYQYLASFIQGELEIDLDYDNSNE